MSIYNQVYPYAQKNEYVPSDIVEFRLTTPSQAIVMNSFKISGYLQPNGVANSGVKVYYDSIIGIHGAFNNFMCSTQMGGVLENKSNYPRYVKQKRSATMALGDIINNSKLAPELVCTDDKLTTVILSSSSKIPFSMTPEICFNSCASSTGSIPALNWTQTGDLTISCRLVTPNEFLYGEDAGNASYTISDLRLDFITIPQIPKPVPLNMLVISEVKQVLSSSSNQINVNLPLNVYSLSASFMRVNKEFNSLYNNVTLEMPSKLSKVFFTMSDNTNNYIGYVLETQADILENYLDSFPEQQGKNDFTLAKVMKNQAYGVGLSFSDAVSLANSFGVNITCEASPTDSYYLYMFFRSYLTM